MNGLPLRFGAFFSPIHSPREDPTRALHRDVERIEALDRLGFDEAWVGEHHSSGWEFVGAPEVLIAYAMARTSRIRLGTGVVSLPYHHPYNVAERAVLIDHLARGRFMLGVGPGALPSDALQIGLDPRESREAMERSLEAMLALLRGERVSMEAPEFRLDQAMLQLPPFSDPHPEIAVTAMQSETGPRLAGRYGLSLMSMFASRVAELDLLERHWRAWSGEAERHGRVADRSRWRLVAPMHIAETEEQAYRDIGYGFGEWFRYFTDVAGLRLIADADVSGWSTERIARRMVASGHVVIGTPDAAVAQIRRLWQASSGFGTLLMWSHDWAGDHATLHSYELFAERVMPALRPRHVTSLLDAEAFVQDTRDVAGPLAREALERAQAST